MLLDDAMQEQARALADPSRFRMFRFIAEAVEPVGVSELTELLGFNHNAIRQHLAVLTEAGLVAEFDEKRTTRGRPRKLYRSRADALHAFRSIAGSYERLADLLLELHVSGDDPFDVGRRAALIDGTAAATPLTRLSDGEPFAELVHLLTLEGFEPEKKDSTTVSLANCPFADIASRAPGVVCELHRGLLAGAIESGAIEAPASTVIELTPKPPATAGCLVRLVAADSA
ncbi:MAG: helix-turn-helix domain-containing protein [Actinomycetota bacterium]